jgi:Transglutaminase-like superfamily
MGYWKLWRRKVATVINLSRPEKVLLLWALILFPLVFVSLHLGGLRFTQNVLKVMPGWLVREAAVIDSAQRTLRDRVWLTVRMVRIAERYHRWWSNCLKKSLVLWALLRVQGLESDLRIGVQREAGEFKAHAWVEYEGEVLNDRSDVAVEFVPFQHSFEVGE